MAKNPTAAFIRSCSTGRTEIVRALLLEGLPADTRDTYGLTGLIWTARKGKIETANVLLAGGAAMEAKDRRLRTAFFHAVTQRQHEFVQYLAEAGADINPVDVHGFTPLDVARGHKKMTSLLERLGGRWAHYDGPPKEPINGSSSFLFGCGASTIDAPFRVEDANAELGFLMNGWTGCYTSAIATFAFRPYIDGSIFKYTEKMGFVGARKATRSRDWLTVKICVPVEWWHPDVESYKHRLIEAVEEGFQSMIGLLRRNRHMIDSESLLADWQTIKRLFLKRRSIPDGGEGRRRELLALANEAAIAIAESQKLGRN